MECAKKLRQFPCWITKNLPSMYVIWCEHNFQMRIANLLVAILLPYLVRLFYEHSTLKLWLKILLSQGKKIEFSTFLYQVIEILQWLNQNN